MTHIYIQKMNSVRRINLGDTSIWDILPVFSVKEMERKMAQAIRTVWTLTLSPLLWHQHKKNSSTWEPDLGFLCQAPMKEPGLPGNWLTDPRTGARKTDREPGALSSAAGKEGLKTQNTNQCSMSEGRGAEFPLAEAGTIWATKWMTQIWVITVNPWVYTDTNDY